MKFFSVPLRASIDFPGSCLKSLFSFVNMMLVFYCKSKFFYLHENCGIVYISNSSPSFNPLHPNISMHILHTVLYTFPDVLTRRIYLINNQELL